MKLPSKIKVGPYNYSIETPDQIMSPDNLPCHGWHNFSTQTIKIRKTDHVNVQRMATLHELLHAVFCAATVDVESEKEEDIIAQITPYLLSLIRENPKLITYLRA